MFQSTYICSYFSESHIFHSFSSILPCFHFTVKTTALQLLTSTCTSKRSQFLKITFDLDLLHICTLSYTIPSAMHKLVAKGVQSPV